MSKVVVVIPAYNACHTIAEVIFKSMDCVDKVVVYDDGSTDATRFIAEKCGATVIGDINNRGKGYALKSLFEFISRFSTDVVVTIDADMQHDPEDIPSIIGPILDGDADVVIGVRSGMSKYRALGNKLLDFLSRRKSSQSGFRAYSKKALDVLGLKEKGFAIDSEILMQLEGKVRIRRVPIQTKYDRFSHTKNPVSHFKEVFTFLFLKRPLLNLGLLGAILFLVGAIELFTVISWWNTYGQLAVGTFLTGMTCLMLGALSFFTGVILHVLKAELKRFKE